MRDGYDLTDEVPTAHEYRALRVAAGPSPKSEAAALAGLANTILMSA